MTELEKAVKDLQDNLLVITEIERRQSALLKEHSERIVQMESNFLEIQEIGKRTDARIDRIGAKLEEVTVKLEEVAEKLDALIHVVDGIVRRPPE